MIREREYDGLVAKVLQSRARCSRCGEFGHTVKDCSKSLNAPLEVPSHNGVYAGTIAPRTIPPGVCGEDVVGAGNWLDKARKGHRVQSRNALANRNKRPRDKDGRFSR